MNKVRQLFTVFSFLSLIPVATFGQVGKVYKDLDYAGDGKIYHQLDIYLPEVNPYKKIVPVVLIYGSAFYGNNMKDSAYKIMATQLLKKGFAVIPINHRASTDSIFPAQVYDVKAAIRYVRTNADKYNLDSSFIAVAGYSSGGYLSAMAGTTSGTGKLEGNVGKNLNVRSDVQVVGNWFGPIDFLVMDSCGSEMRHNDANSPESVLIGGSIQENKELVKAANPITYISSRTPKFFTIHGTADPLVPYCQSKILAAALNKHKIKGIFKTVENGGHGPGVFTEHNFNLMADFFTLEYLAHQAYKMYK